MINHFQDKYTRVMRDKADLSDKADQLEHIVLQLQGETDTIGELFTRSRKMSRLVENPTMWFPNRSDKLACIVTEDG